MFRTLALVPVLALLLAACSPASSPAPDVLAEEGLDGSDPVALIEELDRVTLDQRSTELFASVRYDEVLVGAVGSDDLESLAIPDDLFYLSIAPYVDATHECHFHSLTTCAGELRNVPVRVTVTD